jgi:trans-aconitate 2-methyltransferase
VGEEHEILLLMPDWNPDQYLRFAGERTRACRDLAARIAVLAPRTVIDLGCGPGNSTAVLRERWPGAEITGLDSSEDMLATACRDYPDIAWLRGDIAEWAADTGPEFDVVFSNAAVQWAPDHATLLPRLFARARVLAIQVPASTEEPAQRLMRDLAASPEWRGRFLHPIVDWHSENAAFYYDALAPHAAAVDLWETTYQHVLDSPDAIVEWYRGTGLRPFLSALAVDDRDRFLAEYRDAIRPHYPARKDGRVLLPFRRLFVIAYR